MVDLPALSESIVVTSPPPAVWAAVTDLDAMARRSPELVGMWLFGKPRVGRSSVNLNRRGLFLWPTFSSITQFAAPTDTTPGRFAFSVWPTDVEWSYEITPHGTGTLLTERRTAVVDPSLAIRITARLALGGQEGHDAEIRHGMVTTLAAIESDLDH